MREVSVAERGELVEHDAEERPLDPAPLLFALVALTDNELQVLQKHLAERADRLRVLVYIEGDEQNQFLFDDIVDRKQIFVRTGDDGQFVIEKRHALVQQTLDLGHSLPVFQRLEEILHRHFKIEPALRTDGCVALDPIPCFGRLLAQHFLVERHDDDVIEVVAETGVCEDAHNVGEIIQLVLGEKLIVQVETAENHVYLSHVVVVVRMKRVV